MKRKDIVIDSTINDIEELQGMVESLVHLIDDTERRVKTIRDLLDIRDISDIAAIAEAYCEVDSLADDLY